MISSALFDLDDTLYDEMTFVTGALADVAKFVAARTNLEAARLLEEMLIVEQRDGRGAVFDAVLADHGLDPTWVKPMLLTYRKAVPVIDFFDDAVPLLSLLSSAGIKIGVVTDGYGLVQSNKAAALNLGSYVDAVVYTNSLGPGAGKPSVVGFETALMMIGGDADSSVYIANDVTKDFVGPRRLGMATVLVDRKIIGNLGEQPAAAQPDHVVSTLAEVSQVLKFESVV